jgi:hypothetical protein
LVIFALLTSAIIFLYVFIWWNTDRLDTKEFKDKFGKLHDGIHLGRNRSNAYYFPNFLLRRLVFFAIPIVMINHPAQQLQIWLLSTVLYIIYFDGSSRFTLMSDNIMYVINDFFCLIQLYHFICFTAFNLDYDQ